MQKDRKELINLIEEKSNISSIISDYISLEKKGNNHVGLCPFHSDTNPSMSVSDSKGIFKCFTCQAGGGPINFVQNYEGISFNDALIKLSEKLGIDWKQYINKRVVKLNPEEVKGWEINQEALTFFKYNLTNSTNQQLNNYVSSRDLNSDIIDKFDIGYSGDGLSTFLINKGYTEDEIVKYGLAKRKDDTTLQDYFINRLIFSIKNRDGKVIGFSGRVIGESKYAKYLNSPETILFKKSKILYNLDVAKTSGNLKKELIVVEGFMDVIALYKAGIENSIATMGTAFTKDHIKDIKFITTNVVLAFDSDVAGINATIQNGKSMSEEGFNLDVVKIPSGKDFDELLKLGKEAVVETLKNKIKFINYYKDMIYKNLDSNMDNISFDVLKKLIHLLSKSNDDFASNMIINEISEKYKIDKELLMKEYNSNRNIRVAEQKTNNVEPPMIPGAYIEEMQPSISRDELYSEVKNISNNPEVKDLEKVKIFSMENTLLYLAMGSESAFSRLKEMSIFFLNEELSLYWSKLNSYSELDKDSKEFNDWIDKLYKNIDNKLVSEINSSEALLDYVEKHENLLNEYNVKKLAQAVKFETAFEAKKHLLKMLAKQKDIIIKKREENG